MQEARELALEPCYEYEAHPLEVRKDDFANS